MRLKKIIALLAVAILCTGCANGQNNGQTNGNENTSMDETKETQEAYINSYIICEYTSAPAYGRNIDFFDMHIRILADNKVEVYFDNFDAMVDGKKITLDKFYTETYEITEEQKQGIIDAIEENDIKTLGDCGTDSCDGSYMNIYLYDENGQISYSCGGLNPIVERFMNVREEIFQLMPDWNFHKARDKAQEALVEYLKGKYPEEYGDLSL